MMTLTYEQAQHVMVWRSEPSFIAAPWAVRARDTAATRTRREFAVTLVAS